MRLRAIKPALTSPNLPRTSPYRNIAQQTTGANVGRDHSADGLGYGPVYFISRYSMSTAYLATAHFKDEDALSARIIQARFTGHFRFACQAPGTPKPHAPNPDR